jgi:hypothetical protein
MPQPTFTGEVEYSLAEHIRPVEITLTFVRLADDKLFDVFGYISVII